MHKSHNYHVAANAANSIIQINALVTEGGP